MKFPVQNLKLEMIDSQVTSRNKTKQRTGLSFTKSNQSFKDNAKNKLTKLSTANWLKVWETWTKEKGHDENIELYEPSELDKLLEQFYASVRKQDGTDFERDSLRVMATAIDRHLKENK